MIETIRNAWKIPELRKKMLFTVFALLIFRLGSAIPVPYINGEGLQEYLKMQSGTILDLMNAMSGSAFAMATIFALSIQPYINSSIIIQLLTIAIPALERLARDGGEEGRKKIASITRYTTVAIALLQGFGYYSLIRSYGLVDNGGLNNVWVGFVIVLTFTAGSAFLMWLGEQITEFGIGNGISILLFAGIVSRGPGMVTDMISGVQMWKGVKAGTVTAETYTALGYSAEQAEAALKQALAPWMIPLIIIGMLALVVFIVFISNAERRLPVQYAKRVVGRKMYGGQSTYIPMKINSTGVMPLIFGFAILQFPATIFAFFPTSGINVWWQGFQSGIWYQIVLAVLIIAFTYFYTSITFNPVDISKNMQQNGGIIPGIRQGRATSDYLSRVSGRLTLFSALFLAVLATIPTMLTRIFGITAPFGASSVLIAVSVGIETIRQVEAQMVMRHHKGFLG